MAKIPVYQPGVIDEAPVPAVRQTSNATPDAFFNDGGAGMIGKGLQQAGNALFEIQAKEQETVDQARVQEKFAQLAKATNESIYGSNGVSTRVGKDAVGVADQWTVDFDKIKGELEQDLTPRQQAMFAKVSQQTYLSNYDNVLKHESRQKVVYEEAQRTNVIETTKRTAALNWGDERMIAMQIDMGLKALRGKPEYKGADADIRSTMEKSLEAEYHAMVVTSALNSENPMAARAYLEKNGQVLRAVNPAGYDKLNDIVRKGVVEKGAEALSTVSLTKGLSEGMSMLDAELDKAKALPEGQARADKIATIELAKKEHKRRFAEGEEVKNTAQRMAAEEAYQFMRQQGGKVLPPLAIRNRMDPKAAFALEQDFRTGGGKAETDWAAYATLREKARNDPEGFAKLDLFKYFGVLGKSERETLLDLQGTISKAKPEKIKHMQSLESFITGYAADNKLYNAGDTKDDYWKFENTVKEQLQRVAKSKGKEVDELTDQDYKQAADWAVMKEAKQAADWAVMREAKRFMFPDRPRFKVRGTEDATKFTPERAVYIDDVPKAEKDKIIEQYRRDKGAFPPHAKIIEIFNLQKGKK